MTTSNRIKVIPTAGANFTVKISTVAWFLRFVIYQKRKDKRTAQKGDNYEKDHRRT